MRRSLALPRRRIIAMLAGGSLALLTACVGPTPSSATSAARSSAASGTATVANAADVSAQTSTRGTALTVLGGNAPGEQDVINAALKQFATQHPGAEATSLNPDNAGNKLDALIAAGTPPSVFTLSPPDLPGYVAKGTLAAIDGFVGAAKYDLTDFYPKALGQYYWKNKLYGLPRGFGNQDLYWNVDLFTKSGATPPPAHWDDPAWTATAFLATAERLTVRNGSPVTQFGYSQNLGLRQWEPWVWLFGGQVMDAANQKCLLGEEPAITGLQFLADLMHAHHVMPTPDEMKAMADDKRFAAGQLAMAMGIPANLTTYRKLTSLSWDAAPMPKQPTAATSGGGIAWMMIAGSARPELTWQLQAWMASAQVQAMECAAATTAPPRKSVATSSCYNDPSQPPKHMNVFLEAPAYVHTDPQVVNWTKVQDLLNPGLASLWAGAKSAQELLPSLAQQITQVIQAS